MTSILMAVIGIGFLIFIHELGHYICARLAGVRVQVFSLGFGQRVWGFVWRGTDYRLSLVPFGGYVRVAGEDPTRRDFLRPDDLYAKGYGARFLFFSGGVIMNVLFALVAFPIVFNQGVPFPAPVVGAIRHGDPAWEAGLQVGDRILSVGDKRIYDFNNMAVEIALAGDRQLDLEIERDGERFVVPIHPRYAEEMGIYAIGISGSTAPEPPRVGSIESDSPAAKAGLRADDRILSIDGNSAIGAAAREAVAGIWKDGAGPVTLEVQRGEETKTITFVPAAKKSAPRIGVTSAGRTVIGIRPRVPVVERLGFQRGDLLVSIDGEPFGGDGLSFLRDGSGEVAFVVERDGRRMPIVAELDAGERAQLVDNVALGTTPGGVWVVPAEDSAASKAGVIAGDQVLEVNGDKIGDWNDLVDAVRAGEDRELVFTLRGVADNASRTLRITPTRREVAKLGFTTIVEDLRHVYRVESFGGALNAGWVASIDLIKQFYVTLKKLITGDVAAKNLGGIVSISRASYHFAERGWAVFIYFLALLSLNLAFVNVLPIPVLDGGHLMFLLIEMAKGSPVSARVLTYSQILGLVFVIALMLFVTYNDILKLL